MNCAKNSLRMDTFYQQFFPHSGKIRNKNKNQIKQLTSLYGYRHFTNNTKHSRYQIEDGYDLSAVSGATDYAILQAWDMTHGKRDEPPPRAVQHSALHKDPGATSRDQRYDNIVRPTT